MQLTEEEKSIIKESLNRKGKRRKDEVKLDNDSNYLLDEIPERMYNGIMFEYYCGRKSQKVKKKVLFSKKLMQVYLMGKI